MKNYFYSPSPSTLYTHTHARARVQSINNIVKSINESKLVGNKDIYVIENKSVMDNFNIIGIEQLQEIVMGLPRKKGMEERISSDILKAMWHVIKEEFVDIINTSVSRGYILQKIGKLQSYRLKNWETKKSK